MTPTKALCLSLAAIALSLVAAAPVVAAPKVVINFVFFPGAGTASLSPVNQYRLAREVVSRTGQNLGVVVRTTNPFPQYNHWRQGNRYIAKLKWLAYQMGLSKNPKSITLFISPMTMDNGHLWTWGLAWWSCRFGTNGIATVSVGERNSYNQDRTTLAYMSAVHEVYHLLGADDEKTPSIMNAAAAIPAANAGRILPLSPQSTAAINRCLSKVK
jgi:hypothetical protein